MPKYIAFCACFTMTLMALVSVFGCTKAQRTAKAQACFESPALHECEVQALADCVTAGTCQERAAAERFFSCLRVCSASANDSGAAGASE